MSSHARTIEEEHATLRGQLERVRAVADDVGEVTVERLREEVAAVHGFLAHTVVPHAVAEGRLLMPVIRREGGKTTVGVRMTECHIQLGRLIDELEALMPSLDTAIPGVTVERELRRVLYGAHTLLTAHLAEADAEVEPMLEARLSQSEREELFAAIERCAKEVTDLLE